MSVSAVVLEYLWKLVKYKLSPETWKRQRVEVDSCRVPDTATTDDQRVYIPSCDITPENYNRDRKWKWFDMAATKAQFYAGSTLMREK